MSRDDVNRAVNIYREAGLLSFYASGPDRDPEYQLVTDADWQVIEGELAVYRNGRATCLTPNQAILAAHCGWWGLSIWRKARTPAKAPTKKGRKQ